MTQFRATIRFHDATAKCPTPAGPYWDIQVRDAGGTVVLNTSSLSRWLTEPWNDHNRNVTPHRGMSPWTPLSEEAQIDWFSAVGFEDFRAAGDEGRIRAGLEVLFPGITVSTLPIVSAALREDEGAPDAYERLPTRQAHRRRV